MWRVGKGLALLVPIAQPELLAMLVIHHRTSPQANADAELELTFEARSKSRLRCFSTTGEDVGLFLERGQQPLHDGECLRAEDGRIVRVRARAEQLLHVTCSSAFELTRAAYHLGNRHVALQVGDGWLRLLDDYVLKDMLVQLGANVEAIEAPFQPEHGAYGGGHHHSHAGEAEFSYAPRLHQFGVRT
ncbi:urease accessory protein UreE [Pseudomonas sp. MT-1]|nr:urease accessory protein UreE [Pseudomonas sp. MT-1]